MMLKLACHQQATHAAKKRHGFLRSQLKPMQGFSLLEMMVVIGLLGIVALGATTLLVDNGDWQRQEETEARWDNIRKAIIGEPNLSLNGSPYVAGYVADMGRLPVSLSELVEQNPQFDSDDDFIDDTPCTVDDDNNAATAKENIEQPAYIGVDIPNYTAASGYTNKIRGGWRGPYIYTAGSRFYGDGWFNQTTGDQCDFDWLFTLQPDTTGLNVYADAVSLKMQSLGGDREAGGTDTAQDYPDSDINMVNESEWTLSVAPITFNVNFNKAVDGTTLPAVVSGLPHELELRIYRYIDNGNADSNANDVDVTPADSTFTVNVGDTFASAQSVTPLSGTPIGPFAAVIWCTNNTPSNLADDTVFDGDCNGNPVDHSPVYFTLTHNTSQVSITWNLP